jgi:preprotein translocase subunit SecF
MFIVKNRKVFYGISIALVVISLVALLMWGLIPGIDFKGGSAMEVTYTGARPEMTVVKAEIDALNFTPSLKDTYQVRPIGDDSYVVKLRSITEAERAELETVLTTGAVKAEVKKFNSIGPVLGQEAARKSMMAVVLVLLAIVLFITFVFRKVSEPVSSWKYGLFSIIALSHDVIIPSGVFAILGHYLGYEVDTLFVTAMLVVLGFSIHDTIVVFDRVRENLGLNNQKSAKDKKEFDVVVGESINQTFVRSVSTSFATLLAVVALYFFGPAATKNFALVLIIGIFFGTYSSIFIASNLLVTNYKMMMNKENKK